MWHTDDRYSTVAKCPRFYTFLTCHNYCATNETLKWTVTVAVGLSLVVECCDYSRRWLGWLHFSYMIGSGCYVLCYSCSLSVVVICYDYSCRWLVRSHWHNWMSSINWLLPRVRKAKTGTKHWAITLSIYTVFQKKTSTHIIGYMLRNSCPILIIFDIKIPHIIWHRMTA